LAIQARGGIAAGMLELPINPGSKNSTTAVTSVGIGGLMSGAGKAGACRRKSVASGWASPVLEGGAGWGMTSAAMY